MKHYVFYYMGKNGSERTEVYSEDMIINEYWKYWSSKMVDKYGDNNELLTRRNCIEDWVTVNWAIEVESPGWICPSCNIDRSKEACPRGHTATLTRHCPMVGTAHVS